jgi:hypothetical protein
LVFSRTCSFSKQNGFPCRNAPMQDEEFCFWHSPEHAEEAAEARRLGGLRRRKEKVTQGAYDFEGLESVTQIRRLLEVAAVDTLALENSVARSRTLAYLSLVALKALEVGELEERVRALEQITRPRMRTIRGRR